MEFGVLPSQARRAISRDPDKLDLRAIPLVRYAQAHAVYRRNNPAEMKRWRGDPMLARVIDNDTADVDVEALTPLLPKALRLPEGKA